MFLQPRHFSTGRCLRYVGTFSQLSDREFISCVGKQDSKEAELLIGTEQGGEGGSRFIHILDYIIENVNVGGLLTTTSMGTQ